MPIYLRPLSLLALLAWTLPLAAQDAPAEEPAPAGTTAEAPAAEAEAETPAAGAEAETPAAGAETETPAETSEAPADAAPEGQAPGLSMGEPEEASGEPEVGQPYIREESGDWALRCLRTEDEDDPCQLYQLLMDGEGNAVAEISVFPLPEGGEAAAGASIVAPLETLLTEDLLLSIDGSEAKRYPFNFCNRAGCVARVGFTAAEVQQFRSGSAAQLTIVPAAAPDQQVDLTISLRGFTAGFENATVPGGDAAE